MRRGSEPGAYMPRRKGVHAHTRVPNTFTDTRLYRYTARTTAYLIVGNVGGAYWFWYTSTPIHDRTVLHAWVILKTSPSDCSLCAAHARVLARERQASKVARETSEYLPPVKSVTNSWSGSSASFFPSFHDGEHSFGVLPLGYTRMNFFFLVTAFDFIVNVLMELSCEPCSDIINVLDVIALDWRCYWISWKES